jgi:tyrosine-protein kinase Etk/Wzc
LTGLEHTSRGRRALRWTLHAVLLVGAMAAAVLAVFPQQYAAVSKVVPPQSSGAGLSSLLGGGGGLASLAPLIGSRQPTEVFLAVARSYEVTVEVARRCAMFDAADGAKAEVQAVRELQAMADINSLKGGLIEFQVVGNDTAVILKVTSAYADVFGERLKALSLLEAAKKQELMQSQLLRASERLVRAQEAMRRFRVSNRLVAPEGIVASAINLSTNLRGRLMAKEVELITLGKLVTPQNAQYKNVEAEVNELRTRLAQFEAASGKESLSFGKLSTDTSEYITLLREQRYSEALFEVFSKYHETLLLEQASAGLNAQVVEAPHLSPGRRLRWSFAVGAVFCLALLLASIFRHRFTGPST